MTLDKFPSIITAVTFFALASAVAHEWAYFGIIGLDFQSLYTTHDYLALLITSIGPSFIFLTVALGIQMAAYRSDEFQIKRVAKSRLGRVIEEWLLEIGWAAGLVVALLFSDETNRFSVYALLALLAIRICIYVLSHQKLIEFRRSPMGLFVCVLPAAMIFSYGLGRDAAYADMKDTKNLYQFRLKDEPAGRTVKVLRILDKGIILFDQGTRTVEFYQTSNIALLSKQAPEWETKSFVCRHWGKLC